MRPKERINTFLSLVDFDKLEQRWETDISDSLRNLILSKAIKDFWLEHPDQRFGQMLINIGYIEDRLPIWMDEEDLILKDQGLPPREYLLWGSIYDKDHKPLEEIRWSLIKDMDTDHIKNILKDVKDNKMGIRKDYLDIFKQELILRNTGNNI